MKLTFSKKNEKPDTQAPPPAKPKFGTKAAAPVWTPHSVASWAGVPTFTPAPELDWNFIYDAFLFQSANAVEENRAQGVFHPSAGLHPSVPHCRRLVMFDLLHAPRSRQSKSPKLTRIFDNGHGRHAQVQRAWKKMAEAGFCGVTGALVEAKGRDEKYSISGSADWIARGVSDDQEPYVVLFDLKTVKSDEWKKLVRPTAKHRLQVNTYLGVFGISTGYVVYENKDTQDWCLPLANFRVNYDHMLYQETRQYCADVLVELHNKGLPEFDQDLCDADKDLCSYVNVCDKARKGVSLKLFDRRPDSVKRRHLNVIGGSR